jgi:SAM-dependent methyltransferase
VESSRHGEVLVFVTATNADFDWLEEAIFAYGYYEKPNIWSLAVDADTRFLAEMIQSLDPKSTLDLGCANGSLLQALADLGIAGEGVEICSFALERALPGVKSRIHHGDILKLATEESSYDVISGLDIFEHLNPNKIDAYLEKIRSILKPGGFVFANIPAFGTDEIFGEVFDCYLPDWETDRASGSYFKTIHVDMHGYPMHGHLIWADTEWWAGLFKKHGFLRITEREKELHRRYDDKLFYARRSFYLFQKPA